MNDTPKVLMNFRLKPQTVAMLRCNSARTGRSLTKVVELAMEQYFQNKIDKVIIANGKMENVVTVTPPDNSTGVATAPQTLPDESVK